MFTKDHDHQYTYLFKYRKRDCTGACMLNYLVNDTIKERRFTIQNFYDGLNQMKITSYHAQHELNIIMGMQMLIDLYV